jgi:hypothetical protein
MARIRKAIVAGLLAAAGALVTAVSNGTALSWPVVGAAVGVGVAAALAVWRVPNAKPPAA